MRLKTNHLQKLTYREQSGLEGRLGDYALIETIPRIPKGFRTQRAPPAGSSPVRSMLFEIRLPGIQLRGV